MNIFGRHVSVAVLITGLVGAAVVIEGAVKTIVDNWQLNPSLALGAAILLGNTVAHIWDTSTGQPSPLITPKS